MKKLIIILFILPSFCFAQNKTGYAQLSGDLNLSKRLGNGFGGSFMVGHNFGNYYSFGAGFDIVKYKNIDKITPSVYGDFRFNFGSNIKKPIPYFTLTPGYFFYKDSFRSGNYVTIVNGGFLIGAGLGCIFYSGTNTAAFVSILYNRFQIKANVQDLSSTSNYDIAKISFGIHF